eukprot:gene11850-biopygen10010
MAHIQSMRGGKDYAADFTSRMKGEGAWAALIGQRFDVACRRLGFNAHRVALDISQFRHALVLGQGSLF